MGGEGAGLRPRVADSCDALVRIPTTGQVGSLNVSVAAAILLFAAGRAEAASS
jgi:23S rRNA (guanosine2251-2'-O)-methyltransferase